MFLNFSVFSVNHKDLLLGDNVWTKYYTNISLDIDVMLYRQTLTLAFVEF